MFQRPIGRGVIEIIAQRPVYHSFIGKLDYYLQTQSLLMFILNCFNH